MFKNCVLVINTKIKGKKLEVVHLSNTETAFLLGRNLDRRCRMFVEDKINHWYEVDLELPMFNKPPVAQEIERCFEHDDIRQIIDASEFIRSPYMRKPKNKTR
jgi:hypothetical protein